MGNNTVSNNKPYYGSLCRKEIGGRLRDARESAKLSRDDVVARDDVDVSRTTLQQWEIGAREASIETLYVLAKAYDVSPASLIFGASETPNFLSVSESDYEHVPFYTAEASAGNGSFLDEHRRPTHHLAFRKRWLTATNQSIKDLVGLIARGDSMEPTIKDRAAIIINTSKREPADGHIYVIRVAEMLWVKRTRWLIDGGLCLKSDNETYDDMILTKKQMCSEDVEIVGQVVHTAYDLVG